MGCFSFICKKSGKAALSTSFNGSPCRIFLLREGKALEEMMGNYNSYGGVFKTTLRTDVKHELYDSFQWKMEWGKVCDLMFDPDKTSGLALVLEEHWDGIVPTEASEQDPNQGWGDDSELMGDVSSGEFERVKNPYHKIY